MTSDAIAHAGRRAMAGGILRPGIFWAVALPLAAGGDLLSAEAAGDESLSAGATVGDLLSAEAAGDSLSTGTASDSLASPFPLAALGEARHSATVTSERLCLPHRHLDPASLDVRHGDRRLLPGRDYLVDPRSGCLSFPDPRTWLGAELEVSYSYFPFELELQYAHRLPATLEVAAAAPDSVVPLARRARESAELPVGGRLQVRGNKTFAVRFGTHRDPSLDQSLDLDVSGEVASGVELRAILSDRDLPLQAQGNTETIDELDKVSLELRSRNLSATLGDYNVEAYGGSFLAYAKRLEGLKAEGKVGERQFVLAAAVAKGQFISQELIGVESKQGPYALTDAGGNGAIVVIAGSETVWMNGERLTRGENNDYTIDYGRAEITFTPSRLVTRDSRITVDFEYSAEAFKRNFYVGGARAAVADSLLTLGVAVVSEADDSGDPLAEMSDAERELLATAGDSAHSVSAAAGVYVGDGAGDYIALGADAALRYQYAGDGRGNYEVNFVDVGTGAGDYLDSLTTAGERAYRYVGFGAGAYLPGRSLAPPVAHRLIDVSGRSRLGEALLVESELAVSGLDLNTLSSQDDLDNGGSAKNLRLTYSPAVDLWGQDLAVKVSGGYRDVGTRFRTLGRVRPADYAYTWNAPAGAFDRGERMRDLGVELSPISGLVLGSELASTRADRYGGERTAFSLRLARRVQGRFRVERGDGLVREPPGTKAAQIGRDRTDRTRDVETGELSTALGFLTPRLHYEREERIERRPDWRNGLVYTQFGGGTEVGLPARSRFVVDLRQRLDRDLGTGRAWADLRRAFEQSYRLEIPRAGTVSLAGGFTRRASTEIATGDRRLSDLIQVDLLHASHDGGVESETHYDVTTSDVSGEEQELVFVGNGQGAYDEFGRYVGSGGDYALRRGEAGSAADLRTRLRLSTRGEVRPRYFLGRPDSLRGPERILAALGFETTMQVDESTRLPLASPRLFFFPSNYQRDDATFNGTFLLRQDVDVLEGNRLLALRLRMERQDDLDQRIAGVKQDHAVRTQGVRVRSSVWSPLSAELEQTWGSAIQEEQARAQAGAVSRLELSQGTTSLDLSGRPKGDTRIGVIIRRRSERERGGSAETGILELVPGFTTHLRQARIDLRYRHVHEKRVGVFPASYRAGLSPGTRSEYDLSVDYRATEHVTVGGGIEGSRPPAQKFNHAARLEVRAFF